MNRLSTDDTEDTARVRGMIYGYKCRACSATLTAYDRCDTLCPCVCGGVFTRDYSGISFGAVPQTTFNLTLNRECSTGRGFDEALKRESEIASMRTGMEHRYERVDPTDRKSLGVTDEGLEATNRQRHKDGLPTYKL